MPVAQAEEAGAEAPKMETIEELFEALESPLLSYALRWVNELSAAEDVVQEAFLKLHSQFDAVREPRRWLYRTVHNLAVNHQRRARKIVPLPTANDRDGSCPVESADPGPLPDEQIVHYESIGFVRLSLETLDARRRELIQLKFVENLSYKEIAARTGLTAGHVGYLLHHSLKEIAAELAKTGIVP